MSTLIAPRFAPLTSHTDAPRGQPGLRRALAVAGCAWLLGLAAPSAHAQAMLLNFDAIPCPTSAIPNGTGGLNWANMFCADGPTTGAGYATGTVSRPNVAFNAFGTPATVTRTGGGLFSLTSAQLTAAFSPAPQVTVEGFVGTTSVAVLTFSPTNTGPTLVDLSAITNVDRVVFTSLPTGQTRQFVLDDLNYSLVPTHAVTTAAVPAAGGSVSCTPNPVPDGASTTCTAVPAAGYTLASFTGCTRVGTTDTCTLTNVTAPATVSANFAAIPVNHAITVTPTANGTLSCTPNPVPDGASTTCTAVPAAGYTVASFTGCTRVGTTDTCTLTNVTAPATVSASFAAAVPVPTLSQWALALLGLLAAALGLRRLRR